MSKAQRGQFVPNNPAKYLAANIKNITYRSSWERSMMLLFIGRASVDHRLGQ
jgi:hypothetical protein